MTELDNRKGPTDHAERLAQLLEILRSRSFTAFEGQAEDIGFECKKVPYNLDREASQMELAKDVTAFANASGGLIVIGLETARVAEHASDVVKAVRTFPHEYFNVQRYQGLLDAHIYPHIKGLRLEWHSSQSSPHEGLASILIPPQDEHFQPFLVNKVVDDKGKVRGSMLGYFERHRDGVTYKDAKDFHYLIRAGHAREETEARLTAMEVILAEIGRKPVRSPSTAPSYTPPPRTNELASLGAPAERVDAAVSLTRLSTRPTYVLFASPVAPVSIPTLFASLRSPLKELLESPPELRPGGFGIDAGNRALIAEGKLRRALDVDSNRDLELWRDGTLIFVAPADKDYLCWGRRDPPPLVINPIAFLESLYLFCALVAAIQEYTEPKNCGVELGLQLRESEGPQRLHLRPGPVHGFGGDLHPSPKPSVSLSATWAEGSIDPGILALRVATRVYEWFGLSHDQIPYTEGTGQQRRVNVETFKTF